MIDLLLAPVMAALVILAIHAYLGLHVIVREIIFVDLAFAQIAALGATVGVIMGLPHGSGRVYGLSFGFTLLGALLFTFTRMERSRVPQEAIIGITFVVASAAVLLISSLTAEGAEHVQETLTGSLLWVQWSEVGRLVAAYALLGGFHLVFRRKMLAVSFDPDSLAHPRIWDFAFYVSFGLVITFSVGVAGAVAIVGGITTSFVWDLTTGPTLVCAFGLVLIVAGALRPLARRVRGAPGPVGA